MKKRLLTSMAFAAMLKLTSVAQCPSNVTTIYSPNNTPTLSCGSSLQPNLAVPSDTYLSIGAVNTPSTVWGNGQVYPNSQGRRDAVAFSIGCKGYTGTGAYFDGTAFDINGNTTEKVLNDFWEYDQATNTWAQKANVPNASGEGPGRRGAIGFAIGNFGYIGGGIDGGANFLTDFRRYDPTTNTWLLRASMPLTNYKAASVDVTNNVGIMVGGYDDLGNPRNTVSMYNAGTNTWFNLPNFDGGVRSEATIMRIGTKVYCGLGYNGSLPFGGYNSSNYKKDWWEFDITSALQNWIQKADYIYETIGATGFGIGNKGYVVPGLIKPGIGAVAKIAEYDPINNTWTNRVSGNSASVLNRCYANSSFVLGGVGYFGFGTGTNGTVGSTTPGVGGFANWYAYYPFVSSVAWSTGASSVEINPNTNVTTVYSATITNIAGITGSASQTIIISPNPILTVNSGSICSGNTFTINPTGAISYTIQGGDPVVSPTSETTYTVQGTNVYGCLSSIETSTVGIYPNPTISVSSGTVCNGVPYVITPSGANTYTIQGGTYTVTPNTTSTYTVTGTSVNGCLSANTATSTVTFVNGPTIAVTNGTIDCNNQSFTISPTGVNTYTIQGGNTVVSPTVSSSYTIAGTAANGCLSANTATCSVYVATVSIPTVPLVYKALDLSGFNHDIVANGTSYATSTTTDFDTQAGNSVRLIDATYTEFGIPNPGRHLPTGGTFTSITAPFPPFQFASYTANNTLKLTGANPTGTLTLNTPEKANRLFLLASSAGGSSNAQIEVLFSDNTTQINSNVLIPDWFNNSPVAIQGFGRVYQNTLDHNNNTSNARLYQILVDINYSNLNKTITGVKVTKTGGAGVAFNVMGITAGQSIQNFCSANTPSIGSLVATGNSLNWYNSSNTLLSNTVTLVDGTTYKVTQTLNGCESQAVEILAKITVNPSAPSVSTQTLCGNSTVSNLNPSTNINWYNVSTGGTVLSPTVTLNLGTNTLYAEQVLNGCNSLARTPVSVFVSNSPSPIITSVSASPSQICANETTSLQVVASQNLYSVSSIPFSPLTATSPIYLCNNGNTVIATSNGDVDEGNWDNLNIGFPFSFMGTSYTQFGVATNGFLYFGGGSPINFNYSYGNTLPSQNSTYPSVGAAYGDLEFTTNGTFINYFLTGVSPNRKLIINWDGKYYNLPGTIKTQAILYETSNTIEIHTYNASGDDAASECIIGGPTGNYAYTVPGRNNSTYTVTTSDAYRFSPISPSYNWSNASTLNNSTISNPVASNLQSNTDYTVTLTVPGIGCTTSSVVSVSVLPAASVSIVASSSVLCAGETATLTASGANSYTWSTGSNASSIVVTPTTTTTYSIAGTSTTCPSSSNAIKTITVNSLPTVGVNSGAICSGASFTMNATGATTYNYSSGSNVVSPTANATYTVTGTGANGCTNKAVSNVTVNTLPTVGVNSGAICSGSSFTMNPTGATTYSYSGGSNVVSPTANNSYTVTGTDANGCKNTAVSSVTVNTSPTVGVNSGAICNGQSFTMVGTGAISYVYSSGSSNVSPTANTSYTVTGTDANGCSAMAVSNVTVNAIPVISAPSVTICAGSSIVLNASGANTYTWSNGVNTASNSVSPTTNTSYTVGGTSAAGCFGNNVVTNVTVGAAPSISVNSATVCAGSSATLTANGATTYTWSNNASGASIVVTPTVNTTYSVSGNLTGCSTGASNTANVEVNALPLISANTSNTLLCIGQSASLTATGANTYAWSNSATGAVIVVTPTANTTYTVTGTDANGCENTATVQQDVSLCTGIENVASSTSANVLIYPNPSNGVFTIEVEQDAKVVIMNALGAVVKNDLLLAGKNSINLYEFATGVYFAKVTIANKQTVVKLIKE